jgi:hypothetical protein
VDGLEEEGRTVTLDRPVPYLGLGTEVGLDLALDLDTFLQGMVARRTTVEEARQTFSDRIRDFH